MMGFTSGRLVRVGDGDAKSESSKGGGDEVGVEKTGAADGV